MRSHVVEARLSNPTGSLAGDSGLNLLGSVVSNVAMFGTILLIARWEGLEVLGLYAVIFAIRALLIVVCGFGMRIALTRFVAASRARRDFSELRGSVLLGVSLPVAVSVLVGIGLFAAAPFLSAHVFPATSEFTFAMRAAAVSLPFAVLMDVSLAASQGFQSMKAYAGIGLIGEPLLRFAATAAALGVGVGLQGAAGALLVASAVTGLLALGYLVRRVRRAPAGRAAVPARRLLRFGAVSWIASLATQGILWIDIIILGTLVPAGEVGVYQVATRVVLAAMFVITPLTTAMAPRIAHYWESGELETLTARYSSIVTWTWRLSLPLLLALLVVPHAALHLFGGGFATGSTVILLLATGALVESAAAPSAVVLNQVGLNRLNMVINIFALAGNIALNLLLVPTLGIEGAAIAWSVTLIVPGVIRVCVVRWRVTPHWPFSVRHLEAAGAALISVAVTWSLVSLTELTWWGDLLLAGVTLIPLYALLIVWMGLSAEESQALKRIQMLAYRQLGTHTPALRRWMTRWRLRSVPRGSSELAIESLISPFRYDILARVDLFRCIRANRELIEQDMDAFMLLAESTTYAVWFDQLMVEPLHLQNAPEVARRRAFRQNVTRAIYLSRSCEREGFNSSYPVTVARVPPGVELEGWSLGEERMVPVDGCHRLALLYESGQTHLNPDQYVEAPIRLARNNTRVMLEALGVSMEDALKFLSWGLVPLKSRDRVDSWSRLLTHLEVPGNLPYIEAWPEASLPAPAKGSTEPSRAYVDL